MIALARERMAQIVQSLLNDEVSAAEAYRRAAAMLREMERDSVVDDVYHYLIHYRDDEDIRSANPGYAEMQQDGLRNCIARLRGSR